MPPSEIRKEARESLAGKWGKAICLTLACSLIAFILEIVILAFKSNEALYYLLTFLVVIVSVPISYGLKISFMKLKRDEKFSVFDFLEDGFKNFVRSWKLELWTLLKLIMPMLCLIVVVVLWMITLSTMSAVGANLSIAFGVILTVLHLACIVYIVVMSLLYVLVEYIAIDKPETSEKDCVLESCKLMKGNRGNFFLLGLSFIGWAILCCITFGIGILWIAPYMQIATVCFYERLKNK